MSESGVKISGDIVIIGAGSAGLAAAVSAAEAGTKNIIVLEKTKKPGGNSTNIGCFFAVNSPLQKRMGIHVSEETAFHDKIAHCNWRVNARLIRDTIRVSGDVAQWLENKGVIFERIMMPGFGSSGPPVSHDVSRKGQFGATGAAILNALSDDCRKYGVKMLFNTRARSITTDGKSFLIAADSETGKTEISAKAVVLSTGGFGGNPEMVEKYFPGFSKLPNSSVPQVTGDGLVMAEGLGAITDDRICLLLLGPSSSVHLGMTTPTIIYVNKEGERYYDESAQFQNYNPDDVANTAARQRDKTTYAIFDAKLKESIAKAPPMGPGGMMEMDKDKMDTDFQKAVTEGKAMVSDSWEKIAGFIGAKPEVLKATIEQYNSFCDYSYDADFFKRPEYLAALRTPPYYATKCQSGINTTFGGIKINHRTEVLNKEDIPISGLYAIGDNAGSWAPATYSHRYPGSAASFAVCSGYIAGQNAAKYIRG